MEYEGVAANETHCKWLDSTLDLVVKYLAGKDKNLAKKMGGDDAFVEKVGQYFSGTVLEARRYLESDPVTSKKPVVRRRRPRSFTTRSYLETIQ